MNKRNLENLIAGVGLIGILFLFCTFVTGIKAALILLAVLGGTGCFAMFAFKGSWRRRMLAAAMVIPVIAMALVVNAADPKTGSGDIIANALKFSWEGTLEQVYNDANLSETGWDATFGHSSTVSETDTDTGAAKKGSFTLTLTATTSNYYVDIEYGKDCNGNQTETPHYYKPGRTTLTATITNADTQRPMRIKNVEVVQEENCSIASLGIEEGDLLQANGGSFEIKVVAQAGETAESVTTATYEVTIEYEYVGYVSLFVDAQENVNYTITTTDSEKSSITVVAGSALAEHEFALGTEITPSITVPSGYILHGWRLSDGRLLGNNEKFTLDNDVTVYPILLATDQEGQVVEKKVFQVGKTAADNNQFWFWEDAVTYAMSDTVTEKTIVLLRDYTLRSDPHVEGTTAKGSAYTKASENGLSCVVPSGITLLIPFDDANTVCTTAPEANADSFVSPTAYRTLTMASGANITVNGAISVSGTASAKYMYNGRPYGPLGYINMQSGSSITVNSGGKLFVWGYIYGAGSVTVKNGGTAYECFQVLDFRGGDVTSQITTDTNSGTYHVFPMSQYYVQNVEVPMKMEAGAVEYGFMAVNVSVAGIQTALVPFMGQGAMFNITSGYLIKDFSESTDRLIVDVHGNVNVAPYTFSIKVSTFGSMTIDTSKYVLPLNQNITINVNSGTLSVSQDLALLPETEINIAVGAYCTLTDDAKLIVYDLDDWGAYCNKSGSGVTFTALPYAKGRASSAKRTSLTKDATICINGTADASNGYAYTTAGEANIYSTGNGIAILRAGSDTVTYQVVQSGTEITSWPEISITPAKLKNGDGSYVDTTTNTYTYCGDCLQWLCETNHGHATNVELGNSLNMYFAFWSDQITEDTKGNYYVTVIHTDADGKQTSQTLTSDLWMTTNIKISETVEQPAYVVPYRGLAAKQMCDTVTITIYNGSNEVEYSWSNSIQDYAMRMLEDHSGNAELRTLLVDMLNYGAACQKHFAAVEGKTIPDENLANALLTNDQKDWDTDDIPIEDKSTGEKTYYIGGNLVTNGNIQFAAAFQDLNAGDIIRYSYQNHWNDSADGKTTNGQFVYTSGEIYYIRNLVVADARELITFTVGTTSWTDSIESYCARMIAAGHDTNGVFTAFMKFADSAEAYLEGGSRI